MNQLSTLVGQADHYAAVRARLFGRTFPPRPAPRIIQSTRGSNITPALPEAESGYCPINMLTGPSWRFLVAYVALRAGLTPQDIIGRSRVRAVSSARHDAIALIYTHQGICPTEIGRLLGRGHSTVLNTMRQRQPVVRGVTSKPVALTSAPVDPQPMPSQEPAAPVSARDRTMDELEEENRQLRELLGIAPTFDFVVRCRNILGLTPAPAKLLNILVEGRVRNHSALYAAYCHAVGDEPAPKIIACQIAHLRKALRPYGVTIKSVWGEGFMMTKLDAARVRDLLGVRAAQ